jgi:hypothetical protein
MEKVIHCVEISLLVKLEHFWTMPRCPNGISKFDGDLDIGKTG